jgi:WXG100 family type VII secretion target
MSGFDTGPHPSFQAEGRVSRRGAAAICAAKDGLPMATVSDNGFALNSFNVTPDELHQAATMVSNRADAIEQHIGELGRYVNNLGEFWQGSAHNAFDELMAQYWVYSGRMTNALTDISTALQGNFVNYSAAERAANTSLGAVALPPPNFG